MQVLLRYWQFGRMKVPLSYTYWFADISPSSSEATAVAILKVEPGV